MTYGQKQAVYRPSRSKPCLAGTQGRSLSSYAYESRAARSIWRSPCCSPPAAASRARVRRRRPPRFRWPSSSTASWTRVAVSASAIPTSIPSRAADEEQLAKAKIADIQADGENIRGHHQARRNRPARRLPRLESPEGTRVRTVTFGSPTVAQAYPFNYRSTGSPSATRRRVAVSRSRVRSISSAR